MLIPWVVRADCLYASLENDKQYSCLAPPHVEVMMNLCWGSECPLVTVGGPQPPKREVPAEYSNLSSTPPCLFVVRGGVSLESPYFPSSRAEPASIIC